MLRHHMAFNVVLQLRRKVTRLVWASQAGLDSVCFPQLLLDVQ
jgi:hypothetical protein